MTDSQKNAAFIETLGVFFGMENKMPRSVARVLSYLLMCDPPHQTAEQIAEALQLSSGAVSGAVTTLLQIGLVSRVSMPRDRRHYYQSDPDGWRQVLRLRLQSVHRGVALAEEGLRLTDNDPRLKVMYDTYKLFESEAERLIERLGL